MPVFCLLLSVTTSGRAYPRAGPLLEFTVQWACLLIKHMWTCRGMGRDSILRTASLRTAHTCMQRSDLIHVHKYTVAAKANPVTFTYL